MEKRYALFLTFLNTNKTQDCWTCTMQFESSSKTFPKINFQFSDTSFETFLKEISFKSNHISIKNMESKGKSLVCCRIIINGSSKVSNTVGVSNIQDALIDQWFVDALKIEPLNQYPMGSTHMVFGRSQFFLNAN